MSPRYLLIVGEDSRAMAEALERRSRLPGFRVAYSNRLLAALVNPSCQCIPVGEGGCILGTLFHRHGPAERLKALAESETASIAASDGQALLSAFWGGYVAAIASSDTVRVMRDPSGLFPCYYTKHRGLNLFASDAEILVECGAEPVSIDLEEIGRQLYRAFVPVPATALRPVHELFAGFALRIRAAPGDQEPCWSPWDHVEIRAEDSEAAAERLFRTVQHCVRAWASTRERLLLGVSGGLDSSIIAACLSKAGQETLCLTMFAGDPEGDERMFARAICDSAGLPLIERPFRLEDVDIEQPLAAHLPRPRDRTQAIAAERVHQTVASEIGADAIMTGNGGDNVFGYSQSAAAIADRYLTEGFGSGVVASLFDVCRQTGCSLFDAFRRAWRLAHRPEGYRVRPNPLFLHPELVAKLGRGDLDHPWLAAPAGALPGKAAHIANILRIQPNLEPLLGYQYELLNPLMSQPIVELCLGVPAWEWRAGGRDRALARRAFARDLPPIIINRRIKGGPSRFAARLLDHFRCPIRERLLGGRLAAQRIIDSKALEQVLNGERPVPNLERVRILELVSAEAWIDHWSSRTGSIETAEPGIKSERRDRLPSSAGPIP